MPRSIVLSLVISTGLYLLVALAVVTLAEPQTLAESDAPLSLAAGRAADSLSAALAWFAMCATATTALITFVTISRLLLGMARDGHMPRLVLFAGSAAMIPLGSVETVASVASLATLVAFIAVNVCLIVLRKKEPDLERPFRVPWAVRGYPVPTVLAIVTALALCTQFGPVVYLVTAGAFVLAGVFYFAGARRLGPEDPGASGGSAGADAPESEQTKRPDRG